MSSILIYFTCCNFDSLALKDAIILPIRLRHLDVVPIYSVILFVESIAVLLDIIPVTVSMDAYYP